MLQNCVDIYDFEATDFKSALVVEGTLTDIEEIQKIMVARTFPLDTVLMSGVSGANVSILDSNGDVFEFTESSNGEYLSNSPFSANGESSYVLRVVIPEGNEYRSEETLVPSKTSIDNLYAERDFNEDGEDEGMFIYVDSFDPTGESKYYRYEYEETYKIIAPFWSPENAYVISPLPEPAVGTRPRTMQEQVCYNTVVSNTIIQQSTTEFAEDRITKFPVRFISRENYILSHRYSILVKQYVQSRAAYAYYKTLETLAGTENLFTQIQTGFLEGNIKSVTNPSDDVIGFFQVSTVSEKRLFFNFSDYFPDERLPDYVSDCPLLAPALITEGGASPLIDGIEQNLIKYYSEYTVPDDGLLTTESPGPYFMVYRVCGDCTVLGNNVAPEFWIE